MYSFWYSHIQPVRPPLDVVHHLVLAGEAVRGRRGRRQLDHHRDARARARAWWSLILDHKNARIARYQLFRFSSCLDLWPAIDPLDAAPHVWEGMSHAEFLDHCRQQRLLQAGEWSHRAPAVAPKDAEL